MVRWAEHDEHVPLKREGSLSDPYGDHDAVDSGNEKQDVTPGLNVTTRASGFTKQESMKYHMKAIARDVMESFRGFQRYRNHEPSQRSVQRARLNIVLTTLLSLVVVILLGGAGWLAYQRVYMPIHRHKLLQEAIHQHAVASRERVARCRGIDWEMACDAMGPAGARRHLKAAADGQIVGDGLEDQYLVSDDPTVTYDENCLRVYRLQLYGNITFPYHASQLLHLGGVSSWKKCRIPNFLPPWRRSQLSFDACFPSTQNATMALFIQHGALRNSEDYFCSFKKLILQQNHRNFEDVIVVAPDVRLTRKMQTPFRLTFNNGPSRRCSPCSLITNTTHWCTLRMPSGIRPSPGATGEWGRNRIQTAVVIKREIPP